MSGFSPISRAPSQRHPPSPPWGCLRSDDATQQLLLGPQPTIAIGSNADSGWEVLRGLGYHRNMPYLEVDGLMPMHCLLEWDADFSTVSIFSNADATRINSSNLRCGQWSTLKDGDVLELQGQSHFSTIMSFQLLAQPTVQCLKAISTSHQHMTSHDSLEYEPSHTADGEACDAAASGQGAALVCELCDGMLDTPVRLQPCSHSFCATCVSHHFGAQLQAGVKPSCPFGCSPVVSAHDDVLLRRAAEQAVLDGSYVGLLLAHNRARASAASSGGTDTAASHFADQQTVAAAGTGHAHAEATGSKAIPQTPPHTAQQQQPGAPLRGSGSATAVPAPGRARSAARGQGLPSDSNNKFLDQIMAQTNIVAGMDDGKDCGPVASQPGSTVQHVDGSSHQSSGAGSGCAPTLHTSIHTYPPITYHTYSATGEVHSGTSTPPSAGVGGRMLTSSSMHGTPPAGPDATVAGPSFAPDQHRYGTPTHSHLVSTSLAQGESYGPRSSEAVHSHADVSPALRAGTDPSRTRMSWASGSQLNSFASSPVWSDGSDMVSPSEAEAQMRSRPGTPLSDDGALPAGSTAGGVAAGDGDVESVQPHRASSPSPQLARGLVRHPPALPPPYPLRQLRLGPDVLQPLPPNLRRRSVDLATVLTPGSWPSLASASASQPPWQAGSRRVSQASGIPRAPAAAGHFVDDTSLQALHEPSLLSRPGTADTTWYHESAYTASHAGFMYESRPQTAEDDHIGYLRRSLPGVSSCPELYWETGMSTHGAQAASSSRGSSTDGGDSVVCTSPVFQVAGGANRHHQVISPSQELFVLRTPRESGDQDGDLGTMGALGQQEPVLHSTPLNKQSHYHSPGMAAQHNAAPCGDEATASELEEVEGSEQAMCITGFGEETEEWQQLAAQGEPFKAPEQMHILCPLDSCHLPLRLGGLKGMLMDRVLLELKEVVDTDQAPNNRLPRMLASLEVTARLCWSDDEAREALASSGAINCLVATMLAFHTQPEMQARACMCFMALVRGEGEVCLANQWQIAKVAGVEAITSAMCAFPRDERVQLAALLCLVPLALDNTMMQANVVQVGLVAVVDAMRNHAASAQIQTKALVLLGVLMQGQDPVQDALRMRMLEVGVEAPVIDALVWHGKQADDVLWASLFAMTMLSQEGGGVSEQALRAFAACRPTLPEQLSVCLSEYVRRMTERGLLPDPVIVNGGESITNRLAHTVARLQEEQQRRCQMYAAAGAAVAAVAGTAGLIYWRGN